MSSGVALADSPGFELVGTLQGKRLTTILSSEGVATRLYNSADASVPSRRVAVRYDKDQAIGADEASKTVFNTTVSAAAEIASALTGRALGSRIAGTEARIPQIQMRVTRLAEGSAIDGHALSGFAIATESQEWRLWISDSLPKLPPAVRDKVVRLTPLAADASSLALYRELSQSLVLRAEAKTRNGWQRVLDTKSIKPHFVKSGEFDLPSGFKRMPPPLAGLAGGLFEPPFIGGFDVPANALRGPGPVMSHPELYVVWAGSQLNSPGSPKRDLMAGILATTKPPYVNRLIEYGIDGISVNGVYEHSDVPPSSVGGINVGAAAQIVYDVQFHDGAPLFWWLFGINDPLFVILVSKGEVDSDSWGGYHFVALSLTQVVLPFPMNLFAHDAMPFAVVKISPDVLNLPSEGIFSQAECATAPTPTIAGLCAQLRALNDGTNLLTHEIVEGATDPYPFFGWSDPGQQPAAKKSELADLCEGHPLPWASSTMIGVTSVSTFWSNGRNACVPESRPSLTLLEPAAGAVLAAPDGVILHGYAVDPVDGQISDRIMWSVDGVSMGIGGTVNAGTLLAGAHSVTAVIQDSRAVQQSATNPFSIRADGPKVSILSPDATLSLSSLLQFGSDQIIAFRGEAFTYQPGDIPPTALAWDDDGTPLGTGPELQKRLQGLGSHTIRLTATNAQGVTGVAIGLIRIVPPTGRPSVLITMPGDHIVVPVDFNAISGGPITFTAKVTDGEGVAVPAEVTWKSDLDGALGSGTSLTRNLSGGGCARSTHRITATATLPSGLAASDSLVIFVGQPC